MHSYYERPPKSLPEDNFEFSFWSGLVAALTWMAGTKAVNAVVRKELRLRELDLKTSWILFFLLIMLACILSDDAEQSWYDRLEHAKEKAFLHGRSAVKAEIEYARKRQQQRVTDYVI